MYKNLKLSRYIYLIMMITFFSACTKSNEDEIIPEEVVNDEISFTIDGVSYKSTNNDVGLAYLLTDFQGEAGYSTQVGYSSEAYYLFEYKITKGGALQYFKLREEKHLGDGTTVTTNFKTPTYKPLNDFQLTKFVYDENSNKVTIEFNGILQSMTNPEDTKQVSGKIMTPIVKFPPYGMDYCYIQSNSGNLNLLSMDYEIYTRGTGNVNIINYFTGDGYFFSIQTNQPIANFDNITFDENSTTNKVVFRKALSPFLVDASSFYEGDIGPNQQSWEEYKTSGNIQITDTYYNSNPGSILHVKGKINLIVKDTDGNVIDILNLDFVTVNQ